MRARCASDHDPFLIAYAQALLGYVRRVAPADLGYDADPDCLRPEIKAALERHATRWISDDAEWDGHASSEDVDDILGDTELEEEAFEEAFLPDC